MSEEMIEMLSGVTREGKPFVHVIWGEKRAQLTPEAAVKHGLDCIEVAQGSLMDAFLSGWIKAKVSGEDTAVAHLLQDFRDFREARVSKLKPENLP